MGKAWSRLRDRWRANPYVVDALIAVFVCVLNLLSLFSGDPNAASAKEPDALAAAFAVLAGGSLAFRRRWPIAVFLVATSATMTNYALDYPEGVSPFIVLIALYTVASRCGRRVTVVATVALLLAITFIVAPSAEMDSGTLVGALAVFTMGAVWGDRTKVRDAYAEQLELRAAEKERERIQAAQQAVAEERLRIARELHDVVAHAMSVVAVQSGVGAHVIDSQPDEAKRILETISRTSRDSLNEMRRLLGVLRSDPASTEAAAELAPAPGLAGLDELVTHVTEAGVPVETSVEGERTAVPIGVDLAAYRIVQEALTNVLKHAGRARVSVSVRYEPKAVHVEVVDDGRGAASTGRAAAGNGSGHGLVGMRERAALYGGELEAGPRPGGGFRVAATLRYAPS